MRVLVVDDDPWSQQVIASQLAQAGFRVDSAGDGWEALITAGHSEPDLIVMEVHLPTTDAWSLAGELRTRLGMTDVPFIFMADESPGLRPGNSFRAGFDQLLTKPFTIVELKAAVEAARAARPGRDAGPVPSKTVGDAPSNRQGSASRPAPSSPPPSASWEMEGLDPALRGSLASFGLSSLLMVIELERMSGLLVLQTPSSAGRLAIRQGRVLRARVEGEQGTHGAHAIYEMLQWCQGTFEFDAGAVAGDDQIGRSTSFLLMEGARLADEHAYAKNKS